MRKRTNTSSSSSSSYNKSILLIVFSIVGFLVYINYTSIGEKENESVIVTSQGHIRQKEESNGDLFVDRDTMIRNPYANQGTQAKIGAWPDLKDRDVDEAIASIKESRPDLRRVDKIPEGSPVTKDWRIDRVRVFYNPKTNQVTGVPRIG